MRFVIPINDPVKEWKTLIDYLKDFIITIVAKKLGVNKTIASLNPRQAVLHRPTAAEYIIDHVCAWYSINKFKKFNKLLDCRDEQKQIMFYNALLPFNGMPADKIMDTLLELIDNFSS